MNFFKNLLNGISHFLTKAAKSCYDMEFYRSVRKGTLGSAFAYAIILHVMLGFVAATMFLPLAMGAKARLSAYLEKTLPENGEVSLTKGQLSTTLSVPYQAGNDDFHFIIDPTHEGLTFPDKLKTEGVMLGRDAVFVRNDRNGMEIREFKDVPDFSVNKEKAMTLLGRIGTPALALGSFFFALFFMTFVFGMTLFTVALYALLAMLFGRLWKVRLPYGRWYAMGLHAVTLPILVDGLFIAFGVPIPFAYTVIYFLIMGSIITDERNQPVSGGPSVTDDLPVPTPTGAEPPKDEPQDGSVSGGDGPDEAKDKPGKDGEGGK